MRLIGNKLLIATNLFLIDAHGSMDSSIGENYSVVHSTPYCHNSLSEKLSAASAIPNSNNTISHDKMQQQQQHAAVSVKFSIKKNHTFVRKCRHSLQKSPSSHQVYGSNASSGSRHSSGIHVTPLPSDSGIVDYEIF
uniref:Uncharacterized protein n=1 Tax=Wuchereria bancrofti TaxID=6293 RepID=A0A1I8F0M6_WUCBA